MQIKKINITLTDQSLNDSRIKAHLEKFRSGTGIQERTVEIKRLLLLALDHQAANVPAVHQRSFPPAPPLPRFTPVEEGQNLMIGHGQSTIKKATEPAPSNVTEKPLPVSDDRLDSIAFLYSQATPPSPLN